MGYDFSMLKKLKDEEMKEFLRCVYDEGRSDAEAGQNLFNLLENKFYQLVANAVVLTRY
jgi:hypothetical protein